MPTTTGMNHEATLSARSWTLGFAPRALLTRVLMSEMLFALGRRVMRISKTLGPLMLPATTASPLDLGTGAVSPVRRASSTALDPATTTPSLSTLAGAS